MLPRASILGMSPIAVISALYSTWLKSGDLKFREHTALLGAKLPYEVLTYDSDNLDWLNSDNSDDKRFRHHLAELNQNGPILISQILAKFI